jgi:hypothetical protein
MTKKTVRFRPTLAQYRGLENAVAAFRADNSCLMSDLEIQKAITKDLMARRSANLLEIANLKKTSEMGLILAIVVIIASSYQIYNAFQSL